MDSDVLVWALVVLIRILFPHCRPLSWPSGLTCFGVIRRVVDMVPHALLWPLALGHTFWCGPLSSTCGLPRFGVALGVWIPPPTLWNAPPLGDTDSHILAPPFDLFTRIQTLWGGPLSY